LDGLDYHKSSYRKNNHGTRGRNEIEKGVFTEEFHNYRIPLVQKRISLINDYIKKSHSILDIGAGGGTFALALKDLTETVDVQEISDLCISNLERLNFNVFQGDFASINFQEKTYDLVTCFHVLEHVKNLDTFYNALVKIVGKYAALEVPIQRPLIEEEKNWDGHYHYFSKESLALFFSKDFNINYIGDGVQMPCLLIILEKK